jgi:hypothetical protein
MPSTSAAALRMPSVMICSIGHPGVVRVWVTRATPSTISVSYTRPAWPRRLAPGARPGVPRLFPRGGSLRGADTELQRLAGDSEGTCCESFHRGFTAAFRCGGTYWTGSVAQTASASTESDELCANQQVDSAPLGSEWAHELW